MQSILGIERPSLEDEIFADERVKKAQRRGAATLDQVGTNWTDERW